MDNFITTLKENNNNLHEDNNKLSAFKYLSKDLIKILDFGETIDTVNKYLWELVEYSVASFVIYNSSEYQVEARTYIKDNVSTSQIDNILKELITYANNEKINNSIKNKTIEPICYGLKPTTENITPFKSNITIPIEVAGKIVGAINISSIKPNLYLDNTKELVETFLNMALLATSKVNTLTQLLNFNTESLIQNLSNGVVMFDTNKNVTLANPAFSMFTGLPKEGYVIEELSKLFKNINLDENIEKALATAQTIQLPRVNLSRFFYEISIIPVKDVQNRVAGGSIVIHDITHIVEVDKAKTEFVSLASHQLRTPLSAIRWYSEILLSEKDSITENEKKECLQAIYDSNIRMIELVNSLLNVSRIELGTFAVEPVITNITTITSEVIKELKNKILTKKQTVEENYSSDIPDMPLDINLVRIVMQNLLTNSIKYTPESGNIKIIITKEDPNLKIIVEDNGYGIPESQKRFIFSKLFRADNIKNKETDGTGLGMYIVKSIVDTAGGTISFESVENKFTRFTITLPLSGMKPIAGSKPLDDSV